MFVSFVPISVQALNLGLEDVGSAATKAGYSSQTNDTTLAATVGKVVQVSLSMIGILFTVLMVYAGFLWMTARGEEGQIDKSKQLITAAVIGLIIVLGSYSITSFVVDGVLKSTTGEEATLGSPVPNDTVPADTEAVVE